MMTGNWLLTTSKVLLYTLVISLRDSREHDIISQEGRFSGVGQVESFAQSARHVAGAGYSRGERPQHEKVAEGLFEDCVVAYTFVEGFVSLGANGRHDMTLERLSELDALRREGAGIAIINLGTT